MSDESGAKRYYVTMHFNPQKPEYKMITVEAISLEASALVFLKDHLIDDSYRFEAEKKFFIIERSSMMRIAIDENPPVKFNAASL